MFNTIKGALNMSDNTYKAYKEEYKPAEFTIRETYDDTNYELNENLNKQVEEIRLEFDSDENTTVYSESDVKRENNLIKPVGLALGTYLIANDEDTMYMIDIHAAAERYNYEHFRIAVRTHAENLALTAAVREEYR